MMSRAGSKKKDGGRMPLGSMDTNLDSSAPTSRKSMGGRQSMAPASSSRQSLAPRQSIAPRQSLAPRQSISGRKSLGGGGASGRRASSSAAMSRSAKSDPRPIGSKEFLRESIRRLIEFFAANNYPQQLSPKQLTCPSVKDVKSMLQFIFRQIDPNFLFDNPAPDRKLKKGDRPPPNYPSWDEMVIHLLKRYRYPFPISKSQLQAAGAIHTWPSLLAVMIWLLEWIQYDRVVHEGESGRNTDKQMEFDCLIGMYQDYLADETVVSAHQTRLEEYYDAKNQEMRDRLESFRERAAAAQAKIDRFQKAQEDLKSGREYVEAACSDVAALDEHIAKNRAHLASVRATKDARATKLAQLDGQLVDEQNELVRLKALVANQPYTPLQVQEMLHQRGMLDAELEKQTTQSQAVQAETFKTAQANAVRLASIARLVDACNDCGAKVAAASEHAAVPYLHEEARFLPESLKADDMLSVDLRASKEHVHAARDAVVAEKRRLVADSKRKDEHMAELADESAELAASVEILTARLEKLSGAHATERTSYQRAEAQWVSEVEDIELANVRRRKDLADEEQRGKKAADAVLAAESEVARASSLALAEQNDLKNEICEMMQVMTEHKVAVQEKLEQMLAHAEEVRAQIDEVQPAHIVQQL